MIQEKLEQSNLLNARIADLVILKERLTSHGIHIRISNGCSDFMADEKEREFVKNYLIESVEAKLKKARADFKKL